MSNKNLDFWVFWKNQEIQQYQAPGSCMETLGWNWGVAVPSRWDTSSALGHKTH